MKKILLLSLFTFTFSLSNAQWVTIPDANFVAWLQTNYPTCMNGNQMDTTCPAILLPTSVNCGNESISDLTGIQYFDNLQHLYCDNNQLTSLPTLSDSLLDLACFFNELTTLPPLPDRLYSLVANYNQLTNLPALPNSLHDLECEFNSLSSLPALPDSLQGLYCYGNQLTSLPNLPNTLFDLSCDSNQLTSLPALPNSLHDLWCSSNQLTNLPILPSNLIILGCAFNQLTSLPTLPGSLLQLACLNNQITDLPPLPDTMQYIDVRNNPLLCLPPFSYFSGPYPEYFNISGTQIICLPNVINHYYFSVPAIDTMPICAVFNPNGCPVYWSIEGFLYNDLSTDCIFQTSELQPHLIKMKLFQNNILIQQGCFYNDYSFLVDSGTYTIEVDTSDFPFYASCPSSGDSVFNVTSSISPSNINFAIQCKPGFDNGAWNIYRTHRFFPNDSTPVHVVAGDVVHSIYNLACSSVVNGEVKVILNGPVSFAAPVAGALSPNINGDTLTYTIADFSLVNATTDFVFTVLTDSTAQLGDQICFNVTVTPTVGDNNISNNTLTHCFSVSNSIDPNEKEVSPIGDLNYPFNDWLTYSIHFQNTGTAPAQHIQILDTLDSDLDESTFQLLSSSFDPMVQLFGNKVNFNFMNVNLPDSVTDAEGSKGYVSYRIKPKQNLAIGTEIENTASIYFDFNSPVVTNTTLNTFVQDNFSPTISSDFQFLVFPNPAKEIVTIELSQPCENCRLEISNTLGQILFSEIMNPKSRNINLKSLSSGVYFINLRSDKFNATKKFVKQ